MWQPIETAPKETEVLVWASGHYWLAYWTAAKDINGQPFNNWTTGWETSGGYDVGYATIGTPTHWMSLPPAPECCHKTRVVGWPCPNNWACPHDTKEPT